LAIPILDEDTPTKPNDEVPVKRPEIFVSFLVAKAPIRQENDLGPRRNDRVKPRDNFPPIVDADQKKGEDNHRFPSPQGAPMEAKSTATQAPTALQ